MERPGLQGLRPAAPLQRFSAHSALELRHRHRPEPLPVAVPGRHQDRRLPDGAVAQGASSRPGEPVHRRRHRPRQDHRGRPHRPRAAAAQESTHRGRRRSRLRAGAVEGGDGGAFRPPVRDPGPRLLGAGAPGAGLRRQPVAHPQPVSGLTQPPHRSRVRRPHARMARQPVSRQPADPGRSPPCGAVEWRALRHRDQVHPRHT